MKLNFLKSDRKGKEKKGRKKKKQAGHGLQDGFGQSARLPVPKPE